MFKQIIAILLIAAFVAQTFNGAFVMLDYYTNPAAFAKNCVNTAKPKLHCNGKCQMMKKLQEEEKKDAQIPARKFEKKIGFFCSDVTVSTVHPDNSLLIAQIFHNYSDKEIKMPRSIFHPPGT